MCESTVSQRNIDDQEHASVGSHTEMREALRATVTQEEFGALVGVSRQAISSLMNEGVLPRDANAGDLLLAYCHRLREVAAGRASGTMGGLDLVQERAALARAQRLAVERKNALAGREVAPVQLLAKVLASSSAVLVEQLDHLPARLRRECPGMSSQARDLVMTVIARARNEWVKAVELGVREVLEGEAPRDADASDEQNDPGAGAV